MKDIFTIRFKEELKSASISQTQLANKIGISKQCISDFKSGKSYPSIQTLRAISNILKVSSDYLLGLENEDGTKTYNNTYNNYGTHKGDVNFK